MSARSLSLTEELEKLEQSITLTLQEIDRNFSKSHRIVTTSILPIIERYGGHSATAWQSSKFWKKFFESSANVSLSGYEEFMDEQSEVLVTSEDESSTEAEYRDGGEGNDTNQIKEESNVDGNSSSQAISSQHDLMRTDDSLLDNGDVSGSTPRLLGQRLARSRFSNNESPYEAMRREMRAEEAGTEQDAESNGDDDGDTEQEDSTAIFEQRTRRLRDITLTPLVLGRNEGPQTGQRQRDPLLHRVLDRAYRLHTTHHRPQNGASPLKSGSSGHARQEIRRDSPISSPEMAIPEFRSEAFLSPLFNTAARMTALGGPQTPMAKKKGFNVLEAENDRDSKGQNCASRYGPFCDEMQSDNDENEFYGMSPPKTIQFAFPPSKLMQTPAREASKRIVEGILLTAGERQDTLDKTL